MKASILTLVICIVGGALLSLMLLDAVDNSFARALVGSLFGAGFGVMGFNNSAIPEINLIVSVLVGIFIFLG